MVEAEISNVTVLWAQRKRYVFLKVEARNMDQNECKVELLPPNIVRITGKNRMNNLAYHMNLDLWHDIWIEKSSFTITDLCVKFNITKKWRKVGFWPRLLKQEGKFRFLKVDWDRWQDPEFIDPKNLLGENIDLEDYDDISQDSDSEKEELPTHLLQDNLNIEPNTEDSTQAKVSKEEAKAESKDESEDSEEDYIPEHLR